MNCCLQNKKPTPGPDQGTKTTSLSELCDRERESTSRSECFKETLSSREPLQKQDFVAQMQPVVSSCTRIPSASNTIGMGTGLPPPSFSGDVYTVRRLHLFRFILQSQYRLSSSVEQQLHLQQPTSATPVVSSLMNHTCFTISNSEHVFVEGLCAITNATVTLQWRSRSVYAHWKKPTIFTVHCRPD